MNGMIKASKTDTCVLFLADDAGVADKDVVQGFRWLDLGGWDCAVPLRPYDTLAQDYGDEEERELTQTLVIDMRQPVYDSRVVFTRRGEGATALMGAFEYELTRCRCSGFCPLPFLRAFWTTNPLMLALPAGWVAEKVTS